MIDESLSLPEGISEVIISICVKWAIDSFSPETVPEPSDQRYSTQSDYQNLWQNLWSLIRIFLDFVFFSKIMIFIKFQGLAPCVKYIWVIYLMCFTKVGIYIMGIIYLQQVLHEDYFYSKLEFIYLLCGYLKSFCRFIEKIFSDIWKDMMLSKEDMVVTKTIRYLS